MRQTQLFNKTLKDAPKEASATSHKLLLRGGFIHQVAAGRYAFLPLGFRVWRKIVGVIDSEMEKIGSQRVVTPTLHPIEIWKKTNRDKAFGDEMIIIEDQNGSTFALGATAEGLMTEIVNSKKPSYKDLPVLIHQFVQKFREEKRPRGGLLRVREFMMKDAYSFHASEKDLLKWYKVFFESYLRIAATFGLEVTPVLADSGAIGGEYNHEFMVESEAGEDSILVCSKCEYAANTEKAEGGFKTYKQDSKQKPREDVEGKGIIGVEELSKFLKIPVHVTTKTLLYETDKGEIVAVMVRGDYDVNETKLRVYLGADLVTLLDEKKLRKITGAEVGYAGPIDLPKKVKVVADLTCRDRVNFEVGTNKTDFHSINVNFERDFNTPEFADLRQVKEGDTCPECDAKLKLKQTIEWGHTFHQGQFYAKPHSASYTSEKGKQEILWQGAYGIGIGRTMAAIVELHNDKDGIIWPMSVAPFQVHLLELKSDASKVYETLLQSGIEVLYDDREASAGEKFADSDLIGIPYRAVFSEKTKGQIEIKKRDEEKAKLVDLNELVKIIKNSK